MPRFILIAAGAAVVAACGDASEPAEPASIEVIEAPPGEAAPGDRLSGIRVRVVDDEGRPVPNVAIEWGGDGTVAPDAEVTDSIGEIAATWTLPRLPYDLNFSFGAGLPGTYRMQVGLPGEPAVHFSTVARAFTVDSMDAGWTMACGTREGTLWCWGRGLHEALTPPKGLGDHGQPVAFPEAGIVAQVRAAYYGVCVLDPAGATRCATWWTGKVFQAVQGAPRFQMLSDGGERFCGLAADSTAWCFHTRDQATIVPRQVSATHRFVWITGGASDDLYIKSAACGLDADRRAWCWGDNQAGQLGNGTTTRSDTPVAVSGGLRWKTLESGVDTVCGISTDDEAWCWGDVNGSYEPARVTIPLVPRPRLAPGWFGAYAWNGRESVQWSRSQYYPGDPMIGQLGIVGLSTGGQQICVLSGMREVYCSWILVYDGSDTSLFPSALVAVPPPEVRAL